MFTEIHGTLLVVDDVSATVETLSDVLGGRVGSLSIRRVETVHAAQALLDENRQSCAPVLILVNVHIGADLKNGLGVLSNLIHSESASGRPILALVNRTNDDALTRCLEMGAADVLGLPLNRLEVAARLGTYLRLAATSETLNGCIEDDEALAEHDALFDLAAYASVGADWEREADEHLRRVRAYTSLLGRKCGMSREESELLGLAGTLYDIGKTGIDDNILLKPGKLTQAERIIIQKHCEIGAKSLEGGNSELLETAKVIAFTHHERWDGSGYPSGLTGEEIPLPGRIVGLVDVFEALTSKRPHKEAWSIQKAAETIREARGTQFDPYLTDIFLEHLDEIQSIRLSLTEHDADTLEPVS